MSKTPRTDEQLKLEAFFDGTGIVETVEIEFAQQLETELADKDRQLAEARAEIEQLKQLWSSNLDVINEELNKQLAEITRQRNAYKKALEMAEDELMAVLDTIKSIGE